MPQSIRDITPTTIAFAGDWHRNARYGRRAISYALDHGAHVILHLGDFGIMGDYDEYLNGLTSVLHCADTNLYFIDGNHEDHPRLAEFPVMEDGTQQLTERIYHLPRGYRWEWGDVRFLGLGGAHSVDRRSRTPGADWWPEETITASQAMTTIQEGEADVMLTHDAPAGWSIPGLTGEDYWPPEELRSAEQHRDMLAIVAEFVRPTWLFHGHFHIRYSLADVPVREHIVLPHVEGLGMDGSSLSENVVIKTLDELRVG